MTHEPTMKAPAVVTLDVPCVGCRYNLRSLSHDAVCPECATPVGKSVAFPWLQFADVAWLKRLRRGVTRILWLILGIAVAYVLFIAIAVLASATRSGSFQVYGPFIATVAGFGAALTWLVCVWDLTAPEPDGSPHARSTSICTWARALIVAGVLGAVVLIGTVISIAAELAVTESPEREIVVIIAIGATCWVSHAIGFFLLLVHMRRIARRDVYTRLGKTMTVLVWGGIAALIAALTVSLLTGFGMAYLVVGSAVAPTTTTTTVVTTGPAGATYVTTVTAGQSVASAPTTMPGSLGPVGGGAPIVPPFRLFSLIMMVSLGTNCVSFAWLVLGIVALFWFRRVFGRAIDTRKAPTTCATE